jgi:hypothetical protein
MTQPPEVPAAYPDLPPPGSWQAPVGEPVAPAAFAPGYPPPQYFAPAPPPPADPGTARRRTAIIAAIAGAIGVIGAVAVWTLVRHEPSASDGSDALSLPDHFATYTRVHGGQEDQLERVMRSLASANPTAKQIIDKAAIGGYANSTGDTPGLITLVMRTSTITGAGGAPSDFFAGLNAMLPSVQPYPAGVHGGSLNCGQLAAGAGSAEVCAWSDARTVGIVLAVRPQLSADEAAMVTNSLRDEID